MPISLESSYCLDASQDMLEIGSDIAFGARLGGIDVDAIVDRDEPFARAVTDEVLAWRKSAASPFDKALMAWLGLINCQNAMKELLWEITGPIAEEFLVRRGLPPMCDIAGRPVTRPVFDVSIPSIQSLRLPYLVHVVIQQHPHVARFAKLLREQYTRTVEAIHGVDPGAFVSFLQNAIAEYQREAAAAQASVERISSDKTPQSPPLGRKRLHQVRKAIRRGTQALNTLVAPHAYEAFISDEGLLIHGHLFDYKARKSGHSIIQNTASPPEAHIPYRLQILDKTGQSLARGCILFDKTPVLDQVIALTLHVRDRESELDLLQVANWSFTQTGRDNPDIRQVFGDAIVDRVHFLENLLAHNTPRMTSYRRRIMDVIQPNVEYTLSQIIGIPIMMYRFLSSPPVAGITELADSLATGALAPYRVAMQVG